MLTLGRAEHASVLASLLALGPEVRRALAALATCPAHQRGVLDALADQWPAELPSGQASAGPARQQA